MKKIMGVILALCAALVVVGCKSLPPASEGMANARKNVPQGTLVGQGIGGDEKKAVEQAKYQLVRAMSAMVKDMVDEFVTSGKLEYKAAEEFKQGVNTMLLRDSLSDAVKQGAGAGGDKKFWAVYYMDKAAVIKVINMAVIASKASHPAEAFTIDGLIDNAYLTQSMKEWKTN